MYDVIIVGGGPAGMTAALYAQRNGKQSLVIEKAGFGGQITHSPKVENFPGTLSISGNELADQMLDQILKQGAEIEFENVISITPRYDTNADPGAPRLPYMFVVQTEEGSAFESRTVILATGVKHRMLGLPGEEDLVGEGISFCAVCDGDFYADKTVCVAGGGNSALQEAILLAGKCKEVIMLQDLPFFTGEARLQEVLFSRPNVRGISGVKITDLHTENGAFTGLSIEKNETDAFIGSMSFASVDFPSVEQAAFEGKRTVSCDGLFVAIGLIPENEPFAILADLNRQGYFDSDEQCLTRTPGVFVAGDCRSKDVRQVTTAASDGATATLAACRYINDRIG